MMIRRWFFLSGVTHIQMEKNAAYLKIWEPP